MQDTMIYFDEGVDDEIKSIYLVVIKNQHPVFKVLFFLDFKR